MLQHLNNLWLKLMPQETEPFDEKDGSVVLIGSIFLIYTLEYNYLEIHGLVGESVHLKDILEVVEWINSQSWEYLDCGLVREKTVGRVIRKVAKRMGWDIVEDSEGDISGEKASWIKFSR